MKPNCDDTGWEFKPDGKTPVSLHDFEEVEVIENAIVQVLRCRKCGEYSIGWKRMEVTDDN